MLLITIPKTEAYNSVTEEFVNFKEITIALEHSLVSISKWESKWEKPFLSDDSKTDEETLDYIRCMTLTQNVKPEAYQRLGGKQIQAINKYIEAPMTATTFADDSKDKKNKKKQIITSELIYYWMIAHNVPVEFQKWHLNRLLTLINVCNVKNGPEKKMSRSEIIKRNRSLNEQRKAKLNTKG